MPRGTFPKGDDMKRSASLMEQFDREVPRKDIFRIFEVADYLGLSGRRVEQLCQEGKFNYFEEEGFKEGAFKVGNSWRITRPALLEFLRRSNQ